MLVGVFAVSLLSQRTSREEDFCKITRMELTPFSAGGGKNPRVLPWKNDGKGGGWRWEWYDESGFPCSYTGTDVDSLNYMSRNFKNRLLCILIEMPLERERSMDTRLSCREREREKTD